MKTPFGKSATGLRLERMKGSPRWLDGAFRNVHPIQPRLKTGVPMPPIREFLCGGALRRPTAALPSIDPRERWAKAPETGLRATWLGHSTVLVEIDGFRVLTDPVWGERASPVSIAGPKRFQPIPVPIAALPPIDVVIISHDHYDHLDYPTIRELAHSDVPFVTSLGVGAHLESWGIAPARITELDWWESLTLRGGDLTITAAPSQHFSGRGVGGRNATLWSSFAVHGRAHSFFFSGDTGLTAEYGDIRTRLGPFDLVMLEVGAFHPAWGDIHLGPDYALEAFALLGSGSFLPVHWGTFDLALHTWDEPAERLLELAPRQDVALVMPKLGQPIEPSRAEQVDPWWRPVASLGKKSPEPREEEAPPGSEALEWPID
jgi:L-ascorbate metabolism protein UlaG (beta-lactamase superfamily)